MATPVTVPKVQTQDRTVNQLQTNISNAMQTVGQQLQNTGAGIGDIKHSAMTLAQVQKQSGIGWVLCDGASCVGSSYNKQSNALTVPNIPEASGIYTYIRIN